MYMYWNNLLNSSRPRGSTIDKDHRVQFERDYDRAVFSTPVKRLQDKAQVFPLDPCDAVRTRLTHSLEVSAVAKGIAIAVAKWLLDRGDIRPGQDRAIEAICATAGLIHDLGNPPFGHAGEKAIASWFIKNADKLRLRESLNNDEQLIQDFLKFEGNAQSLRLVTKLQILSDFHGLNLTYGTLSASCKYIAKSDEANSDATDHAFSKPGHFASENNVVEAIRNATGTGKARNPLTFLVEAADDLVYSVADVEDGVKKKIITWEELREAISSDKSSMAKQIIDRLENILKAGRYEYPDDLPDDVFASALRTATIGLVVPSIAAAFQNRIDAIINGQYSSELIKDCEGNSVVERLKKLGRERVYCTDATLKLELMGRRVISDLMDVMWEGASTMPLQGAPKSKNFEGKAAALLSENYRKVFQNSVASGFPERYCRFQLLTDQICGMTDSYAKRLHAELMNGC
jgi:dGTPase